ncbi:hypothetical protein ABUJ23_17820 [Salmonella enterica subsp. enterica serovar Typhimurium var. monophasic]|uniref:hypothetical protein n=1 Tax=Salmonella enterica TaxID=28901 RepID=UPI00107CFB5D|nr:DUF4102 domain-containing protein [Salmonella enterica subsp. enterica serovar Telelkebir]EAX5290680.1 DUF4102 domain-containing protein [Salmonella enterica]ECI7415556.1 DUF4102 domain-containing protein [Salmonella enterica subsp. enterica]ECK9221349.1 DUF4102 domain-containing protein [Salmonella enterica subsp. enterica serovar Diguel]EAC0912781.1 DUF4102 domain-containing protein [Salmonella enterica subsp. enterica serovar Telelkebir]
MSIGPYPAVSLGYAREIRDKAKKRWRDPLTKKYLNLNKLVDLLNAKAEHLMVKDSSLRLKVIGLDLTASYLSPAH